MAKGVYIGVSSKARKVKSIYVGISNVARRVKKAYIGVNNVAKLFYQYKTVEDFVLTDSNPFVIPSGCNKIDIFCVGGGGGAGGSYFSEDGSTDAGGTHYETTAYGANGGGGYTTTATNISVTPGESLTVVFGAGGAGGKSYNYMNGRYWGDTSVTSISGITSGSDGGETYVSRNGTKLCTANGGKGGTKTSISTNHSRNAVAGVDGGNASGAGGGCIETQTYNSSGQTSIWSASFYGKSGASDEGDIAYYQQWGDNGTEGGNGGSVDRWTGNLMTMSFSKQSGGSVSGGTGQGRNTRAFGDSSATVYSTVGTTIQAYTGNSGEATVHSNRTYLDRYGSSGAIIIRCYY